MSVETYRDPRSQLMREKYFSIRPKPLERWLWSQNVPPAAERVFWLHWQEGLLRGDWHSEVPLKRVARECQLDLSTVTRAYQVLQKMGCIRRTDPGRDPANPFQQATAVTEVRVPRELLVELDRHPNRRPAPVDKAPEGASAEPAATPAAAVPAVPAPRKPADPFAGLRGRDRIKALAQLTHAMSAGEEQAYREALRTHQGHMRFDTESKLSAEECGKVLQFLSCLAVQPARAEVPAVPAPAVRGPRKLSVFELARLKRDIQAATTSAASPELMRQVVWSIEEGSLRRFPPIHALHIALKKIREGTWTRPNRMPPNWARALTSLETCRRA